MRSYAKAGFRPVKTMYVEDEEPGNTGWEQVMLLERKEWEGLQDG